MDPVNPIVTPSRTPRISIVHCGSRRIGEICTHIKDLGGVYETVSLEQAGKQSCQGFDGIIISGGPHLFTDTSRAFGLIEQFAFIDKLEIPTLGICLGHQAIGIRHGSKVYRGEKRVGEEEIHLKGDHPFVIGLDQRTVFYENHREGISLPEGFVLLGSSLHYAVEIMVSASKPLFGVQFHPEVSGNPGKILFGNFMQIVAKHMLG